MKEERYGKKRPAHVLIVEDHPLMREGLNARISSQSDLVVCGESSSAGEALAMMREKAPDLVIVDLKLKKGHGLELIKEIRNQDPDIKVLVVTAYEESLYCERALRAGALGYLTKLEAPGEFLDAVRAVLAGRRYLSEEMAGRLVEQAIEGKKRKAGADPVQSLSDRELEVFELIGQGMTTSAIARHLHLSVHTIESHREKIRFKLKLKDGSELLRRAVQWVLENQ
jgi:DNA-binding NarL/FixJ family response regulator